MSAARLFLVKEGPQGPLTTPRVLPEPTRAILWVLAILVTPLFKLTLRHGHGGADEIQLSLVDT